MKYSMFCLLVFTLVLFSSCEKSNESFDQSENIELREGNVMDKRKCFEFVYPITIILPDNALITGDSREEIGKAIREWYKNNADVKERPSLQYPVTIVFAKTDEAIIINSPEGLERVQEKCKDAAGSDKECITFLFPISYEMPDGSTITGENHEAIRNSMKEWYEAHPDSKEKAKLIYPIKVTFIGYDQVITIHNENELLKLRKKCEDKVGDSNGDDKECFKLIYPVSYKMPDGTLISGDNEDALFGAIKEWYAAHPDFDKKPTLVYPVKVSLAKNDAIITIHNEEEMIALKKKCE